MTYYMNRLASIAASEAVIVAGSGILNVPISEGGKAALEYRRMDQAAPDQAAQGSRTGGQPITSSPPIISKEAYEGLYPGNNSPLRQIEQNKLLGIAPGQ